MQSRFDFRSPLTLFLFGIALYIIFGVVWWQGVYQSPQRVFEGMLANNLATSNVTKNEFVTSSGQTSVQRISLQLGGTNVARSLVTLRSTAGGVTTETIGTPKTAYVRYVAISDQSKHNYNKALNVWAQAGTDSQSVNLKNLFAQSLLDISVAPVPPLGNVYPEKRAEMLQYIKDQDIFTPDYSTVKTVTVNGRKVYEYSVAVKLAPYVELMQEFSHVYGLITLDNVSANDYQSANPVSLTVDVDRLSHQMVRVSESSGFNETYTDYGIDRHITVPTKSITTDQLRSRLKSVK